MKVSEPARKQEILVEGNHPNKFCANVWADEAVMEQVKNMPAVTSVSGPHSDGSHFVQIDHRYDPAEVWAAIEALVSSWLPF